MEMIKKLARGWIVIDRKELADLYVKGIQVYFCSIKQDGEEFEVFIKLDRSNEH